MGQEKDDRLGRREGSAVQPHGLLVAVDADWIVTHVSANLREWLPVQPERLLARPLSTVLGTACLHALRGRLQLLNEPGAVERLFGLALQEGGAAFDVVMYRCDDLIVIEAEPAQPEVDAAELVRAMARRLRTTQGLDGLCREAVRQMRVLSGYDSVTLCRQDGAGVEVLAESARPSLRAAAASTLRFGDFAEPSPEAGGSPYAIADAMAEAVEVLPAKGWPPLLLAPVGLCAPAERLRDRLQAEGIASVLIVQILRGHRPWGTLICKGVRPRRMALRLKTAIELFSQLTGLMVESREREQPPSSRGDPPAGGWPDRGARSEHDRQELVIAELNHRIRNILGLIHGVVAQSRSSAATVEEYASVVGDRIRALARANDQITRAQGTPGSLTALISAEVGAYLGERGERVRLEGDDVLLEPRAFSALALVVHELTTNAAKYGALSVPGGRVTVRWALTEAGELHAQWRESGGPTVRPPSRRGFGSTIIERSIPYELGGEAVLAFDPDGVTVRLRIPGEHLSRRTRTDPVSATAPRERDPSWAMPDSVLVVEDNAIIALEAVEMLRQLGAPHVEAAASVDEALRMLEAAGPAFALLDVSLHEQSCLPVARRLRALGTPFVFATGYGDRLSVPEDLRSVPVVEKPYSAATLLDVLRDAAAPR